MNITLTSLEALVLKATNESLPCPDPAALEAFCAIMRDAAEGYQLAVQALAARAHSGNPREALLALSMLDRCMRRGDVSFQAEVGKFRFLNEMIKLVSPKYFADRTAPEVKTRVLQLFHAWSIEYPKESKFRVAYDMLKNQGVVKETPPPLPPEDAASAPRTRPKNAIFDDEDKSKLLQKLLQSKKPEDLQHANRLIRTMVKEDERRLQAYSRRAHELRSIHDLVGLLREMLACAGAATGEERDLIHELYTSAQRLRPSLQSLAGDGDYGLDDILHVVTELDEVSEKYTAFFNDSNKTPDEVTPKPNANSLLDFAGANTSGDVTRSEGSKNAMDELGDIFCTEEPAAIAEPLMPVNLMAKEGSAPPECGREGWSALDTLGARLLRQSLPAAAGAARRQDGFSSKTTKKIPMNALDKMSPKDALPVANNDNILDLDFFTKKPEEPPKSVQIPSSSLADDIMVDISTDCTNGTNATNSCSPDNDSPLDTILDLNIHSSYTKNDTNSPLESSVITTNGTDVKLTDINLTLDSVTPSKLPPMTVFEEEGGVAIVLHFCEDKPRPNVDVIVVSTTSKSGSAIEDFRLQAVVPKACKVRLLSPSGVSLPAPRPFLPPPALTQLLLLHTPAGAERALTLVLTYTCRGEVVSDIAHVKRLPTV